MTFQKKIIIKSMIMDFLSAIAIFTYSVLSTHIFPKVWLPSFKYIIPAYIIIQLCIQPLGAHLVFYRISNRLEDFKSNLLNEQERTKLLEQLMLYPFIMGFLTGLYFIIVFSMIFFVFRFVNHMNHRILSILVMEWTCGSYFAGLFAYSYTMKLCNSYAQKIINMGLNKKYIANKKIFGQSLWHQTIFYIIIPFILTILISTSIAISSYLPLSNAMLRPGRTVLMNQMLTTSLSNIIILIFLTMLFYTKLFHNNKLMRLTLEKIKNSNIFQNNFFKTDLNDEIAYNQYLANETLKRMLSILESSESIGNEISKSANTLITISNETEATAVEQSTATKEILSTMEEMKAPAKKIEDSISHITDLSDKTAQEVLEGYTALQEKLKKMEEITQLNNKLIIGIRELSSKVTSIGDIINVINAVADQTKLIAFNAELEANKVHGDEQNFRNVATEIRRLANKIMDSTHEIKNYIIQIQDARDILTHNSQNNTYQIQQGMELSRTLNQHFGNISRSANTNANASAEIKDLIGQENVSFKQVIITLKQITNGIQNFSTSTRTLTDTSSILRANSDKLKILYAETEKED
ncbi:MAG: hypothetical protein K6G00_09665 [Treponema sp.]|nr:hypothetical protein [Treponema sp.]